MIRTVLDKLYIWSGYLAGVFLAGIGVAIIAQVVGRFFRVSIDGTEIAGFCLAATSFFALAHTFKSGSHIRVNLLIRRFTGKSRRLVELWCCGISAVIVGYVAYHAILLSIQSYQFHDISPGLAAMPFWIPQAGMAAGLILLTVALVDELVSVAGNNEPSYEAAKDTALD
jgi:TRAP-type C4-dicarboxylate transport system permease small subunit